MAKARQIPLRPFPNVPLPTVDMVVADLRPTDPLFCLRPATIAGAAQRFTRCFPGDVLYAVKSNPDPSVLAALWAGGVRHFDCASLAEIMLVRKLLLAAEVHFMHLVKARPAIGESFDRWGVTDFSFDSADELAKILQETVPVGLIGDPPSLGLFVRLALPKGGAVYVVSTIHARCRHMRWGRRRAGGDGATISVCVVRRRMGNARDWVIRGDLFRAFPAPPQARPRPRRIDHQNPRCGDPRAVRG